MPSDLTLSRSTCELDLRNARIEAAVHEADLGTLARLGQKALQDLGQLRGVRAAAVLQHEREAAGGAQARGSAAD